MLGEHAGLKPYADNVSVEPLQYLSHILNFRGDGGLKPNTPFGVNNADSD
jgi:hypothetical protein